jgi:preprotein translocase subunit SecD
MLQFPKWKIFLVLLVSIAGIVLAAPNMLPRSTTDKLPSWLQPVNLGLDLQGGSYLLLEVDGKYVVHEQLTTLVESVRTTLRKNHIRYLDLGVAGGTGVHVRIPDAADRDRARNALRKIDTDTVTEMADDGTVTLHYPQRVMAERLSQVVEQSLEIVRRRIDQLGTREPAIQREGTDRIVVQLPGVKDPGRVKELLGKTARLTFQMVDDSVTPAEAERGHLPPGSELLPAANHEPGLPTVYVVRRRVDVGGGMLTNAQATFDSSGQAVVNFKFNAEGAKRFGDTTKENVGRLLAIVLDGKVISAPRINEAILGGSGQISGNFTIQQAKDLALLLRAGALPAPLSILEQRTVGPDLGADSIHAGEMASIIGLIAVVVFMGLVYGTLGLLADVALVLNLVLLLALLSLLGATLTLPGIAGIVLTMGMAVDANVLIYERIREEIRAGRTIVNGVHAGFERAFSTILDANVTTLVAALLLFQFGSGPIRGFGVTLALGLMSSMFTAIMVTRLLVSTWIRWRRPKTLPL